MPIPLKLTVYKGSELAAEQRFERDIVKIGRLASAHLRLDDTKVSRIHAVIESSGDGTEYSIIDMGSTEGTFLNGEKVSKEKLGDGDELRLGDCRIIISFEGDEAKDSDTALPEPIPSAMPVPAEPPPPPAASGDLWTAAPQELAAAQATEQVAAYAPTDIPQQPQVGGQVYPTGVPSQDIVGYPTHDVAPQAVVGAQPDPSMMQQGVPQQYPQQMAQQVAQQMAPGTIPPGMVTPGMMAPQGTIPPGMMASPQGTIPPGTIPPGMVAPGMVAQGMVAQGTIPPGMMAPQGTIPPGAMAPAMPQPGAQQTGPIAYQQDPWGAVPNNLASDGVPDTERALEVKALWGGTTVIDSVSVTDQPVVSIGDERKITGRGPFQKVVRCDIEVPSKNLPAKTFNIAESMGQNGCNYVINVPQNFAGRIERADGTLIPLEQLFGGGPGVEPGDSPGGIRYTLQPAETMYLVYDSIVFQVRYVRKTRLVPPLLVERLNYTWLNTLVLAFFFHAMAIVSFEATPVTQAELTEDIFKNPNRFAQFRLTPEQRRKQQNILSKLKAGEMGAKAKGKEGKAGRKDYKGKKQGRMAIKGDPTKKELVKSTLNKLFGTNRGNTRMSQLFGSGGLGGELKGALGGVTGAEIGDATGLGGLGTRGSGPGGGGLSMNSVGLGSLGTRGVGGGGGSGYGDGIGNLGKKADRDINISAGSPRIMGSLDKEIIRRVIKQHIAQIRYCYEKELVRSPGLFGKVATKFTIAATGFVQSAGVEQSTLKNKEVERCITAKIRTWKFPKPKGGGIVIVKYPFIFKTSG